MHPCCVGQQGPPGSAGREWGWGWFWPSGQGRRGSKPARLHCWLCPRSFPIPGTAFLLPLSARTPGWAAETPPRWLLLSEGSAASWAPPTPRPCWLLSGCGRQCPHSVSCVPPVTLSVHLRGRVVGSSPISCGHSRVGGMAEHPARAPTAGTELPVLTQARPTTPRRSPSAAPAAPRSPFSSSRPVCTWRTSRAFRERGRTLPVPPGPAGLSRDAARGVARTRFRHSLCMFPGDADAI